MNGYGDGHAVYWGSDGAAFALGSEQLVAPDVAVVEASRSEVGVKRYPGRRL